METHGTDWTRPWATSGGGGPRNIVSNAYYRGINILLLGLSAHQQDFDTHYWATYRQWKMKGGMVRKGQKGTMGVFYKNRTIGEGDEERTIPVMKHFFLFNLDQVDDIEIEQPEPLPEPERIEIVEEFISDSGANIIQGGNRACYSPVSDKIRIPEIGAFGDAEAYYSTLFHELSHWTGHKSRLNRADGMQSRFGYSAYAIEELVAEISSAFLSISLGVSHEPRADHAKYLNSWLQVLKDDMRAFTNAASKAQAAADYLVGLQDRLVVAA